MSRLFRRMKLKTTALSLHLKLLLILMRGESIGAGVVSRMLMASVSVLENGWVIASYTLTLPID
jgi:hypothetical protein